MTYYKSIETQYAAIDLWHDSRREDSQEELLMFQDEATIKMYIDHAESLALYKQSGGTV